MFCVLLKIIRPKRSNQCCSFGAYVGLQKCPMQVSRNFFETFSYCTCIKIQKMECCDIDHEYLSNMLYVGMHSSDTVETRMPIVCI